MMEGKRERERVCVCCRLPIVLMFQKKHPIPTPTPAPFATFCFYLACTSVDELQRDSFQIHRGLAVMSININ